MNTKLTLRLDSRLIEAAKELSKARHRSLSKLVENYFRLLLGKEEEKEVVTPVVSELSGILSGRKISSDFMGDYYRSREKKHR